MEDKIGYEPVWTLRKYENDKAYEEKTPYEVKTIEGNLLLNEGITRFLNLLIGGGGTTFANANA